MKLYTSWLWGSRLRDEDQDYSCANALGYGYVEDYFSEFFL